jgi:signal transduction histidine kinase
MRGGVRARAASTHDDPRPVVQARAGRGIGDRVTLLLIGLAIAGALLATAVAYLMVTSTTLPSQAFTIPLVLLAGVVPVVTGLAVWRYRPANRLGALLVATGFAWLLGALRTSDHAALYVLGLVTSYLFLAVTVHVLLAYPSGRLQGSDRLLALASYVLLLTLAVIPLPFLDTGDHGLPDNPFLLYEHNSVAQALLALRDVVGGLIGLVVAVTLIRRWWRASGRERRLAAPVAIGGAFVCALMALSFTTDATPVPGSVPETVNLVSLFAYGAVPFLFVFAVLHTTLRSGIAIGDLVERLQHRPARGELRSALAAALDDPTVQVAFWLPESERFVDEDGHEVALPDAGDPERAWTEVDLDGERVAAIVHDASLREQPELLAAAGSAAAIALDNARLDAALRARIEELRESRARVVQAADDARRRIERNLHDGAQQQLVALSMTLGLGSSMLERDPAQAKALFDQARKELDAAIEQLVDLARGIHPTVLADRGLPAAIDSLARRSRVPVEVHTEVDRRLPEQVEIAAYFIVSEALTNVAKYARASRATVDLRLKGDALVVKISDDGTGGADPKGGSGLRGLDDRVAALEGRLTVHSPVGEGTTITAELPCGS